MTKRCFIAINLPADIKEKIAGLTVELKKINSNPGARFVKSDNIHLTLHFLDDLNESQINQVDIILKDIVRSYSQTTLITENIGGFPNLNFPRVVFIETREARSSLLNELQKAIGQRLEDIGMTVDHRPWRPHLTLARITGRINFQAKHISLPKIEIPITSIELMESQLGPGGSKYKIINTYKLK
jgi:2'-5' RNA ligase